MQNDGEWDACLTEASEVKNGKQLRQLFSVILVQCNPSNPMELWEKHKESMCDDRLFAGTDDKENAGLLDIQTRLARMNKTMEDVGMVEPVEDERVGLPRELQEELAYDRKFLNDAWVRDSKLMNADQKKAFTGIVDSLKKKDGKCFFIDAPGGLFFSLFSFFLFIPKKSHQNDTLQFN